MSNKKTLIADVFVAVYLLITLVDVHSVTV